MATNALLSNQTGLLKTVWSQKDIYEMVCKVCPFLGMVPKDTNTHQLYWRTTVGYGLSQGLGSTYATARSNRVPSVQAEFSLQAKPYYGSAVIDGRVTRRAKYDVAFVLDTVKRESTNLLMQAQKDFSTYLQGNAGGSLGQVLSVNSNTITLTYGQDLKNFAIGMTCTASTADGTSGSERSGTMVVTALGTYDSPTVTFGTIVVGTAANDYIFRSGTFGATITGLGGWLPAHSGSPSALLGVTRSTSPFALAGVSINGAGETSVKSAILKLARYMADTTGPLPGGQTVFMGTVLWESLANELQGSSLFRLSKVPAAKVGSLSIGVEYDAIEIVGPLGTMKVVASPYIPDGVIRILTLDRIKLKTSGPLFQWIDGARIENGQLKMENDDDAYEIRLVSDGELDCGEAPGHHGIIYNVAA